MMFLVWIAPEKHVVWTSLDCRTNISFSSVTEVLRHSDFDAILTEPDDDDVVLRHTLPVFTGLGRCPVVSWDFAGEVSIFGPDALPVIHQ